MSKDRRLAAIMFTDLVGYSATAQQDEALAMQLLEEHQAILRPVFAKFNGQEIKTTGDGFLVEFASAIEAVNCAIEIQGGINTRNASAASDRQIQIRIGIHMGEVERRDDDIYGNGVNVAARIEPLADAGGICVSATVHDLVKAKVQVPFISLGAPVMKNIQEVVEVFKVVLPWEEKVEAKIKPQPYLLRKVPLAVVTVAVVVTAIITWWATTNSTSTDIVPLQPGEISSIAVIPFENLSSDPENQYFTEGLAEEMRNALVKIDGLRVPSYTSSSSDTMHDLSLKEIAGLLGVEAVLEGSVRKSGNQLRISAQLIRASDDTHLWSETFDRQMGDIFEIQEEIAESILFKLGYALDSNQQIVNAGTDNSEAYNLYLQGRFHWSNRTQGGLAVAVDYFKQAIDLDPEYAQAYVGLADASINQAERGYLSDNTDLTYAEELVDTALEINPALAEAYASKGIIAMRFHLNYAAAESYFLKSIQLDPSYPTVHHWYRILLDRQGRRKEAFEHAKIARDLDPLSPIILLNHADELFLQKDFETALKEFETALLHN
jgi:class 3 adenylate cyclase/TolB-like protein